MRNHADIGCQDAGERVHSSAGKHAVSKIAASTWGRTSSKFEGTQPRLALSLNGTLLNDAQLIQHGEGQRATLRRRAD